MPSPEYLDAVVVYYFAEMGRLPTPARSRTFSAGQRRLCSYDRATGPI